MTKKDFDTMKKAHDIKIHRYPGNIEVYAYRDDDDGQWGGGGRIYTCSTSSDDIPSPAYIPTIRAIHEACGGYITLAHAKSIKRAISIQAEGNGW